MVLNVTVDTFSHLPRKTFDLYICQSLSGSRTQLMHVDFANLGACVGASKPPKTLDILSYKNEISSVIHGEYGHWQVRSETSQFQTFPYHRNYQVGKVAVWIGFKKKNHTSVAARKRSGNLQEIFVWELNPAFARRAFVEHGKFSSQYTTKDVRYRRHRDIVNVHRRVCRFENLDQCPCRNAGLLGGQIKSCSRVNRLQGNL